jgi:hypothetical protein
MDFFYLAGLTLAVPLSQIALLLTLSTLALLFRRIRLALIINYLFALYWGYGFNREFLLNFDFGKIVTFTIVYFGFGLLILVLALIGFTMRSD